MPNPIPFFSSIVLLATIFVCIYLAQRSSLRFFTLMAIGWSTNLIYLLRLEPGTLRLEALGAPSLTLITGSLGSAAFLGAALRLGTRRKIGVFLLVVLGTLAAVVLCASGAALIAKACKASDQIQFAAEATPHILFASVSIMLLASRLATWIAGQTGRIAPFAGALVAIPLYCYGGVQFAYLFRQFNDAQAAVFVQGAFWIALVCKAVHLSGIVYIAYRQDLLRLLAAPTSEEAVAERGHVLGTISHEMKAPLQALRNYSVVAERELEASEGMKAAGPLREAVEGMVSESRRMMDIHDEMRALSEPLSAENRGPVTATKVLQDAASAYRKSYSVDAIRFREHFSEALVVDAHEGRLRQVFMNALRNAGESIQERLKNSAAPRGQIDLWAERVWVGEKGMARIRIVDNGIGISNRVRGRLFAPYFSTKGGTNRGLGMYISKQLVYSMGGSITLTEAGAGRRGAELTVMLPLFQD